MSVRISKARYFGEPEPRLPTFDVNISKTDQRLQTTTTTMTTMTPSQTMAPKIQLKQNQFRTFITIVLSLPLLHFFGGFKLPQIDSKTLAPHEPEKATDDTKKIITTTATVDNKWHQGKKPCGCDADYYYAGSVTKGLFFNSEEDCCEWFPDACSNKAIVPGLWYLTEVEGKPTCMFGASDDPGGWAEETDLFANKRECCNEICDHWILLRMMSWEVDDCSLFGTGMSLGDPLHQVTMQELMK